MKLIVFCSSREEARVLAGIMPVTAVDTAQRAVEVLTSGGSVAVGPGLVTGWRAPDPDCVVVHTRSFSAKAMQAMLVQSSARVHRVGMS